MYTKKEVLKKYFGYDSFREGQDYLIDNILNKENVVGIMPTGAGKSICFQVPAIIFDGITIVVSPLISLMKDQVLKLKDAGIRACYINSSLTKSQCDKALENAKNGMYKIIYVAPERLMTLEFLNFAKMTKISMLTIDEAHCISKWGQDFRPSYSRIIDFVNSLDEKPVISAFTATATKEVKEDIITKLCLNNPKTLVTGFDRKNLEFIVEKSSKKKDSLLSFIKNKKDEFGIIYCLTRKEVFKVTELLNANGYNAKPYHAGLDDYERTKNQDDFIFDRVNIIVATNAFGMGIDKPNVSYVIHYNMPKNIESYYQEAGRCGRDGSKGICLLLFNGQDVRMNSFLIDNGQNTDNLDIETLELIKQEDKKRLKEITMYCHTDECLRSYILKYFGESPIPNCNNCSSCNDEFENIDITIDAQKILSCIVRTNESFGSKRTIEILKGSKNKQLLNLKLDKLSTYGILDKSPKYIQSVIDYLIVNDFLYQTSDEYNILKLSKRANEVLVKRINIEMKQKLKEKKEILLEDNKKGLNKFAVNEQLFNLLKEVRLKIATAKNVPSFVIFHDSTLIDMCMKLPINKDAFLEVSGVGQVKNEQYGESFISVIKNYVESIGLDNLEKINTVNLVDVTKIEEPINISTLSDKINCILLQKDYSKISSKTITNYLIDNNFITVNNNEPKTTIKGTEIGITIEAIESEYKKVYYNIICSVQLSEIIISYFVNEKNK